MIDDYATEFKRWLVGSAAERDEWSAELVAHLSEADEAGQLDTALSRLGSPRVAAQEFSGGRELITAPMGRRLLANVVDYAPLLAVSVGLLLQSIASGGATPPPPSWYLLIAGHGIWGAFPPVLQFDPRQGLLEIVGVPAALAWSIVGVACLEAITGSTLASILCRFARCRKAVPL